MKKRIYLAIGIFIILILLTLWAYILFFGTPDLIKDRFGNFNTDSEPILDEDTIDNETEINDDEGETDSRIPLRQISTSPVAGFDFIDVVNNEGGIERVVTHIYFIKSGTGHIYKYDIENRERNRISNITIQNTQSGFFTPDGKKAVAVVNNGFNNRTLTLIDISHTGASNITSEISGHIDNITMSEHGNLFYTKRNNDGGIHAISLNLESLEEEILFTFPLYQVKVAWGPNEDDSHYIYERPAPTITSSVYEVKNNSIRRTNISGYDLQLITNGNEVAYSMLEIPEQITTRISEYKAENFTIPLFTSIFSDKCTFVLNESIVCAIQSNKETSYTGWSKGTYKTNDIFIEISLDYETKRDLFSPLQLIKQELDVYSLQISLSGHIGFLNRLDNGLLWLYSF